MSLTGSNIDRIRAEIMRLEGLQAFDWLAWEMVLADLRAAGRVLALADAERRMQTALRNQLEPMPAVVLIVSPPLQLMHGVAVETEVRHE